MDFVQLHAQIEQQEVVNNDFVQYSIRVGCVLVHTTKCLLRIQILPYAQTQTKLCMLREKGSRAIRCHG